MNFNRHQDKILLLIPAIVMFFLALIPTLKYQWPLSWDIIYHVQYAKIYAQYGYVLVDPLLNAPVGQKIGYPPLFHFLLISLASTLKIDYFQIARFLQPIFAALIVLSVSYVAKEFYGKIAGISTGFLIISSYLIHRIILPIPENLALIFLPLAVYFYYISIKEGILKYALISGLLFIVIISTHPAAPLCLFITVTSFTILKIALDKNLTVLKNYGAFFFTLLILIAIGAIALIILKPDLLFSIFGQGLTAITGFQTSMHISKSMNAVGYLGTLGAMILLFAIVGSVFAIKKMQKKHLFIFVWIIAMFLLSNAYWFGINVTTYRVLVYLLIPLSIFGGYGLSQLYYKFKDYKTFSSRKFRSIFLISIFILCTFFGVLTIENPKIAEFGTNTKYGSVQIAPPTDSEVDLANWFKENGDKNKSILISNLYSGIFISSETLMPINYRFDVFVNITPKSHFEEYNIGYIVYDKRLTFKSDDGKLYMKLYYSDFATLHFFSGDIKANINQIKPNFAQIVYENKDFIVCKI